MLIYINFCCLNQQPEQSAQTNKLKRILSQMNCELRVTTHKNDLHETFYFQAILINWILTIACNQIHFYFAKRKFYLRHKIVEIRLFLAFAYVVVSNGESYRLNYHAVINRHWNANVTLTVHAMRNHWANNFPSITKLNKVKLCIKLEAERVVFSAPKT